MNKIYQKHLMIGLGAGLIGAMMARLTSPIVTGLALIFYMVLIGHMEKKSYDKLEKLSNLIKNDPRREEEIADLTGLEIGLVEMLRQDKYFMPFEKKDIDHAIDQLRKPDNMASD